MIFIFFFFEYNFVIVMSKIMNYSSFNVIKYISIAHRKFDWFNLNEIFRRKNKLRQPITFYLHENFINLWPLEKIFLRLLLFSLINFKHENPWNNFFPM